MNTDKVNGWETQLDRELKALPPRPAPPTLIPRVLAAVGQSAAAPWYRRPWSTWPAPVRAASLLGLLIAFGGLCYGSVAWLQIAGVRAALNSVAAELVRLETFGRAAVILGEGLGHALQSFGPGTLGLVAGWLLLGYLGCLGLTALCARLAFAPGTSGGKA